MRIWFNHWFSTAVHLIALLRQDWGDVEIIGSHPQEWAAYQYACDRWGIEPDIQGQVYAFWCLDFAREQQVDVFVPWQGLRDIAAIQNEFTAAGIKVLVPKAGKILSVLSDKAATYDWLMNVRPELVPPYCAARAASIWALTRWASAMSPGVSGVQASTARGCPSSSTAAYTTTQWVTGCRSLSWMLPARTSTAMLMLLLPV